MMAAPPQMPNPEGFDVVQALRSLATLADRLRQPEKKNCPRKGNYEPNS